MRTVQTQDKFPLSSVKPLESLMKYRSFCLETVKKSVAQGARQRDRSPVTGTKLEPAGEVEGLAYGKCPDTGGLFLSTLAEHAVWADCLSQISRHRYSPETADSGLEQSRADHVYVSKVEWIQNALRLQGIERPQLVEFASVPSNVTRHLSASPVFAGVTTLNEMDGVIGRVSPEGRDAGPFGAAVLFESLDRVDDPAALLKAVSKNLEKGGLVFLTGLVTSGFDFSVLGFSNFYLYPPDRTNCFTLKGLSMLFEKTGFTLLEVSTPGVLDVEVVDTHRKHNPSLSVPGFVQQVLDGGPDTREAFQDFLQRQHLSSYARIVARKGNSHEPYFS